MSLANIIEFLNHNIGEIEKSKLSNEGVQKIIDFGLDTKNKLSLLKLSPGSNFMQSIDLFQNLLDEEFKGDDEFFFNESKKDLIMDISLLISRLEKLG